MIEWKDVNKELPEYMKGYSTSEDVLLFSKYTKTSDTYSFTGYLTKFSNPPSIAFSGNNGQVYHKCHSFINDRNWQITHWAYINQPKETI